MKTRLLAVTGGIACGKSAAALHLSRLGGEVLDTDIVTHSLQGPGGAAAEVVAREFGAGVMAPDGSVDRRRLGAVVFADAAAMARLDAILHPLISEKVREWVGQGTSAVFKAVLVPLLYEAGFDKVFGWDMTLAIVCSEAEQIRRLKGRGFSEEEAKARIAAQMPCAEKARRADMAIWNDEGFDHLYKEVEKAVERLLA
ncbi:MAG: dephospho-CoA kinase [Kiritimatiellae bacterium]|nr:dephospho-CoA kinase [Kiritimatiellia bacterium]